MLCLSGFELYSRWVPLRKLACYERWQTSSIKDINKGAAVYAP